MGDDKIKGLSINKDGYGFIPKSVMQDKNLAIATKAVYSYFCSFTGAGDSCFPTRKKICFDLNISNDSLSKYLQQLVKNGYLQITQIKENGRFSHNIYTLPDTKLPCPKISDTGETEHGKTDTKNNSVKSNKVLKSNIDNIIAEFETLWKMYPRKQGKTKALKAYQKAIKEGVSFETVEQGIKAYCEYIKKNKVKGEYIKHGSTWFNGYCWNDEYTTKKPETEDNKKYGGTYL